MMETSEENIYKSVDLKGCLKWTFQWIRYSGYWFPRNSSKSAILLHIVYSSVAISSTLLACISMQLAYAVYVFGQLEEMVNSLFILLTHSTQTVKVLIFIIRREKIYSLLDRIDEDIFKPRSALQHEIAMKIMTYTNRMAKSLMALVIAAVSLFAVFPLLEKNSTSLVSF